MEPDGLMLGMDTTGAGAGVCAGARIAYIVRVEVLDGSYLYAIKIHITGETFDLCPADICRMPTGAGADRAACPVDAPKNGAVGRGAFNPGAGGDREVERMMAKAGIELGGVEYMVDDRDGRRLYYDINALSNFVADGEKVVGFDPFVRLADWLEREAGGGEPGHQSEAGGIRMTPHDRPDGGGSLMRYGFWLPVFGGWLRNVDDEGMAASWEYARDLAVTRRADWATT